MNKEIGINKIDQPEMPFALVLGSPLNKLPKDLYIPPDALEVFLEAFEGPLDLLLYLIRRQNLDILDIPLAKITEQYMLYIDLMEVLQLDLAGEYLLMAAMLAEIKTRMLLPRYDETEAEETDPRAELIRRLQDYERYKEAAENLQTLPRMERDLFAVTVSIPDQQQLPKKQPEVSIESILLAFTETLNRVDLFSHHLVYKETLSIRERMGIILDKVNPDSFIDFHDCFSIEEGRAGVIVSLLAILQLIKDSLIQIVQNETDSFIYVKAT